MSAHNKSYHEPLALVIISSISLGLGALAALFILIDIILRRGWRSMMAIMIPVYIINALYLWPLTLWTYLNYGRPKKPAVNPKTKPLIPPPPPPPPHDSDESSLPPQKESQEAPQPTPSCCHHAPLTEKPPRPLFATITVAVCHCGAGCVLGDLIGEWLVYSTQHARMHNAEKMMLYLSFPIDFAFAIFIGIIFQYYSIAPMSGEYGWKTVWRAAQADFLSLVFFEMGLFAWMAVFQIALFEGGLGMDTVTYWWMMQVGMVCGHWTGVPINWWLIRTGVKEPCA